jgi:hypothetical protein
MTRSKAHWPSSPKVPHVLKEAAHLQAHRLHHIRIQGTWDYRGHGITERFERYGKPNGTFGKHEAWGWSPALRYPRCHRLRGDDRLGGLTEPFSGSTVVEGSLAFNCKCAANINERQYRSRLLGEWRLSFSDRSGDWGTEGKGEVRFFLFFRARKEKGVKSTLDSNRTW